MTRHPLAENDRIIRNRRGIPEADGRHYLQVKLPYGSIFRR